MGKRIEYIDTLRVIACFLVILTHSAMPSATGDDGLVKGGLSFLGSPSSELFLALSGAVLLPVHTSMREFYKRRFLKLLPPVICWSCVILLVHASTGKISWDAALHSFVMMPLQPVIGVYWFIYVMIGLYLLAPMISPWLASASKRQVQFFLLLWFINLSLPYLNVWVSGTFDQNGSHYWVLNFFGGFLGYWLLGYYLRTYPIRVKHNVGWIFVLVGLMAYMVTLVVLRRKGMDIAPYMDNLQIGSALLVIFLVTVIQHAPIRYAWLSKIISSVAKYSFGIYLIHIMVARDLVWLFFEHYRMPALVETLLIASVSLALSYGILKLLSLLPKSKYIVGC